MITDTRLFPYAIPAGGMQHLPISGEKFLIQSTTDVVSVTWGGGRLDGLLAGQGYRVRRGFQQLTLNNDTAGAISGVIQISDDDFIDNRVAGEVALDGGTTFVQTQATVTNADSVLVAANPNRKYLLIQNKDSAGNLYLNYSGVCTVANGIKITAGGSTDTVLAVHQGAVNAIGDIASNANVIVIEG